MPIERESHAQFGANAIGARDQDGFTVALRQFKKRPETADARKHALTHGFACQRLDAINQGIASLNINACVFIAQCRLQVLV